MSYEIHLLHVQTGEVPRAIFERHLDQRARELNSGPAEPAKEAEKERLARALMRFHPALVRAEFDFAGVARIEDLEEHEARRQYRHVELNADDYTGIQITLWDDTAEITFPYWHNGEQALSVLYQVWECLSVLTKWGAFVPFDPQLDKVLDLESDFSKVWHVYSDDNPIALKNVSR
jgi:hypothetical protein